MRSEELSALLADVASGAVSPDDAASRLSALPFAELTVPGSDEPVARIDHHRELRTGFPETIYCAGKTAEQVAVIASEMLSRGDVLLATRCDDAQYEAVAEVTPDVQRSEAARVMWVDRRPEPPRIGNILIATGGTSDLPVAEEAAVCAEVMGNRVTRLYDVGVAGVHRVLANRDRLDDAEVVVCVAGMEGALPSIVAGLVRVPVVGVPTSIGYGATFGGLSALLTMMTSCAPGIGVVNIDNGFGAATLASRINHLAARGGRA